ncbi:toll-like receptor 6 [Anopheles funestus]|uniref:toll-like receptor 6 n=1 Tax=Anopheles funestus TaxID=62324 RepID=UPI0020C72B64|nr:toll-like receptor 6 [Anopheles funestus]
MMTRYLVPLCVVTIAGLLGHIGSFKFDCRKKRQSDPCKIDNWNPSEEGYFVLKYTPENSSRATLRNLQASTLDGQFCTELGNVFESFTIENSPMLKTASFYHDCNVSGVELFKSSIFRVTFEQNSFIRDFKIKNSPMRSIPPTLSNLLNVGKILIRMCKIESVDLNSFCPLNNLEFLNLGQNKITYIQRLTNASCMPNLSIIDLDYNELKRINFEVFWPLANLKQFNFRNNKIDTISGKLMNPDVHNLILSHNRLKVLDFCNWQGTQVISLNLMSNNLTRVPRCLYKILSKNTKMIPLRINQIERFEAEDFEQLPNVEMIDMSHNKIVSIPLNESLYPPMLVALNLYENQIVSVPNGTFERIRVRLGETPAQMKSSYYLRSRLKI